jgi:hypothetical protein
VVSQAGDLITFWTGDSVVVFDSADIRYRYTVAPTASQTPLGPGIMMAGKLLIPVTGAMGVYDPGTGSIERYIPVDRGPAQAAVIPAVAGSTVIEQRGGTVVALGQR